MATNASSDVNWDNDSVLTQNGAENKEVLIDDVNYKIYTIKDYIPKKITKRFLKPSYIILSLLILILIIIIGILIHNINDSMSQNNLSNTSTAINSTSLYESVHEIQHDVDEKISYSVTYEETTSITSIRADDTTYYSIIDTTTEENLLSTYEPNEEENYSPNEIILCEENVIWLYEINSQNLTLLYKSEHVIKTLEIDSNKTLFLSEENKIVVLNKKENQTEMNVDLIFEESRVNPKSMAIDTINNNLYIVDESMGGLIVINTQNKYYSLLLMDLKAPSSIALDPSKGIMFIGTSVSILKGNMDGTSLQPIFVSTHIGTITLDKKRERIYWIQDFENIMSSDYTGSDTKHVLEDHASISELMVLGNRLFWLRVAEGMNTSLWSCSVKDDDCNDHSLHYTESVKYPKLVRGVGRLDSALKRHRNSSTRRRCDHLSLAMPSDQVSCACNMGWQLVYKKTCQPYGEFALYTLGDTIRARFLDTSRAYSLEYIWPTPFTVDSLTYKSSIDFDYDSKNDNFYFSDDSNIYQMKIKGKDYSNQKVIMTSRGCIKYLVYDWFTGNIYFTSRTKGNNDYYIQVFNPRRNNIIKTDLVNRISCSHGYYSYVCLHGLAISPLYGYIFFTSLVDTYTLRIRRFRYVIKNDQVLNDVVGIYDMNYNVNDYTLWFTVDSIKNRLYCISSREGLINHVNFNGTDEKQILPSLNMREVQSASAHKQWIYFNCGKSIWKLHKETGKTIKMMEIEDNRNIGSFKIISQPEDNKNPCRNNNGGCEHFCFVGPTAICNCSDTFTPASNGTCTSE